MAEIRCILYTRLYNITLSDPKNHMSFLIEISLLLAFSLLLKKLRYIVEEVLSSLRPRVFFLWKLALREQKLCWLHFTLKYICTWNNYIILHKYNFKKRVTKNLLFISGGILNPNLTGQMNADGVKLIAIADCLYPYNPTVDVEYSIQVIIMVIEISVFRSVLSFSNLFGAWTYMYLLVSWSIQKKYSKTHL